MLSQPRLLSLYKSTSELGTPLYTGKTAGSQLCPLLGVSTIYRSYKFMMSSWCYTQNLRSNRQIKHWAPETKQGTQGDEKLFIMCVLQVLQYNI